jgi:hypothetical protein
MFMAHDMSMSLATLHAVGVTPVGVLHDLASCAKQLCSRGTMGHTLLYTYTQHKNSTVISFKQMRLLE